MNEPHIRNDLKGNEIHMPNEKQSELFIRLLTDALEADRLTRTAIRSAQNKANRAKSKMLFASDLTYAMDSLEPLDCLQQMNGPKIPSLYKWID